MGYEKDLVKVKHCDCGYTVFCNLDETKTECVCGKVLEMEDEIDATMTFEIYEDWYNDKNIIIERDNDIMDAICYIWNEFSQLEQTHSDDLKDFHEGIHILQKVMGMRELRRLMPHKYPVK